MSGVNTCNRPLHVIHDAHGALLQRCATLRQLADDLAQGRADGVAARAEDVLVYFNEAAEIHHQDEEQDLFPLMRAALDVETAAASHLLDALQLEHQTLAAQWAALALPLQKLADGAVADLPLTLCDAFAQGYFKHVAQEEQQLLPLAEYLLKPAQLKTLGAAMSARCQQVTKEEKGAA